MDTAWTDRPVEVVVLKQEHAPSPRNSTNQLCQKNRFWNWPWVSVVVVECKFPCATWWWNCTFLILVFVFLTIPKTTLYLYGGSKSKGIWGPLCFCYGTSVKNLMQKFTSPVHLIECRKKGNLYEKALNLKIGMPFPLFYKYEKQTWNLSTLYCR